MSLDLLAVGTLSGHGMLMLLFTTGVFAVFAWDKFQLGSVCLAVLILLPTLFFAFPMPGVEPFRFFDGFGHPALVAICALMILGHALVLTGALDPAARRLAWLVEKAPWLALLVVLVVAGAASAVMNDTPVVVLLMPLLIAALRRAGRTPAFMLMPMNFAVLIGGMSTTIGTSTNLIVVALAASLGAHAFGVFEFLPLVAMAALPALLYLWVVAPWMLRHVDAPQPADVQPVFDAELRVAAGTWLDGAQVRDVMRRTGGRLPLRQIRRASGALASPLATATLHAGDRLVVQDTAENLKDYEARLKTPLHSFEDAGGAAPDADAAGADRGHEVGRDLCLQHHEGMAGLAVGGVDRWQEGVPRGRRLRAPAADRGLRAQPRAHPQCTRRPPRRDRGLRASVYPTLPRPRRSRT